MGSDKAQALFHGRPLIAVALATFAEAGIDAHIAGFRSSLEGYAPAIPDAFADLGPLGGIHSALAAGGHEWFVFLPVDMPLMSASLLACLMERAILTGAPITALLRNGRLEPFPVVLHRSVSSPLSERLRQGHTACHAAWRAIPAQLGSDLDCPAVENLIQCGQVHDPSGLPAALWFQSANTPTDLARLGRLAKENIRLARNQDISVTLDA